MDGIVESLKKADWCHPIDLRVFEQSSSLPICGDNELCYLIVPPIEAVAEQAL